MSDSLTAQATSKAGFIRAYGMFWVADEIDWKARRPELLGRINKYRPALRMANFWDQRGIYVLYNDYGPYYVGRTHGSSMSLGKRLRDHATGSNNSPHAGKWDRFSWFGWRAVRKTTDDRGLQLLRELPSKLLTNSTQTVEDIEALLIYSLGTIHTGNSREETFKAAVRWDQVWWHERDDYLAKVAP